MDLPFRPGRTFTAVQTLQQTDMEVDDEEQIEVSRIYENEFPTYPFPNIKQKSGVTTYSGMEMPPEIESLQKHSPFPIPSNANEELSTELLDEVLGGENVGDGIYFLDKGNRFGFKKHMDLYLLLNLSYNPLAPTVPGQHGAQISCFPGSYQSSFEPICAFPVFSGYGHRYRYMGEYTKFRQSTDLSCDQMSRIPKRIKEFWAERLSSKTPEALDGLHFCWSTELTEQRAQELTYENILQALHRDGGQDAPRLTMFYVPLRFLYYNENLLGDIVFDKEAFGEKDETPLPAPSFGNPSYTPKPFTRESLQHYPVQRELEWIANEAEIQVMPRYGKLVMTYQRGELAQEECSHLKSGERSTKQRGGKGARRGGRNKRKMLEDRQDSEYGTDGRGEKRQRLEISHISQAQDITMSNAIEGGNLNGPPRLENGYRIPSYVPANAKKNGVQAIIGWMDGKIMQGEMDEIL